VRKECQNLDHDPLTYLKRFYYDTISHSTESLGYLLELVGPEQVMLGSDYCFDMGLERPVEVVTGHPDLSDKQRVMILQGNARRLLGL
jgi:aminocarboxymuconate-semialdehyde decarboxylase